MALHVFLFVMLTDGVQAKNRLPVSVRDQMITILVKMMEMWRNCVDELSLGKEKIDYKSLP